jgi:drug/metabolite transporter (DMT)-like permease
MVPSPTMSNSLLYITTVAIWGSSWIAITYQLGTVAPEASIIYRFVLSSIILIGWCVLRRLKLRFTLKEHLYMALQGVLLFSINYVIFYFATMYLTSGLVAVAFSTIVIMNIVFGALLLGVPIRLRVAVAALFGLGGLALVFWSEIAGFNFGSGGLTGLLLSLVATVSASLGNVTSARNQGAGIPVIQGNAFGMVYGSLFTLLVALIRGVPFTFDFRLPYLISLFHLALFATVIGFGSYLTLLGRIGPDRAAYVSVVFPIVSLGLSTLFEGYHWTGTAFVGVLLILIGNLVVLMRWPGRGWRGKPWEKSEGRTA